MSSPFVPTELQGINNPINFSGYNLAPIHENYEEAGI
jgi:hypothetical protein